MTLLLNSIIELKPWAIAENPVWEIRDCFSNALACILAIILLVLIDASVDFVRALAITLVLAREFLEITCDTTTSPLVTVGIPRIPSEVFISPFSSRFKSESSSNNPDNSSPRREDNIDPIASSSAASFLAWL